MLPAITHFAQVIGRLFVRWLDHVSEPKKLYFACGTCERNLQCGHPPDAQCPVRAMQIARGDFRVPRPRWPIAF